jgi:hypothetical protein
MAAVAATGCLGAQQTPDQADAQSADTGGNATSWAADVLAFGDGHDHANTADHRNLTTRNFETVGWDPLVGNETEATPRGNLCGDVKETDEGRQLAAVESRGDVVFSLVDVTDEKNPRKLGEFVMRTTYVYDMAVVPDGEHVALTTSNPKAPHESPADGGKAPIAWRSPCTGGEAVPLGLHEWTPSGSQVILVDISDPEDPKVADQRPIPGLGHSIWSGEAGDRTWITAATWAATSGTSNFQFYGLQEGPTGTQLEDLSTWTLAMSGEEPPQNLTRYMGHNEVEVHEHPVTGQTLAYLALWDHGTVLLDMEDPRNPEMVAQWDVYDPGTEAQGGETMNAHEARPVGDVWNGRHYTVVGPENPSRPEATPTGVVHVLDTTDPANPQRVAVWTLPEDVNWDGRLMWSPHYLQVQGETLFISMYHGGVWAVDMSPLARGEVPADGPPVELEAAGVYAPARESPKPPEDPFRWTPTMEEVHVLDGEHLTTWSSNSGLYTFTYDESTSVPHPDPWGVGDAVPLDEVD